MESYRNPSESTQAEQKLNAARQEVNHIVDKIGTRIDEEIKETIAILRAMDFPTSSSCSGHTEKDYRAAPYVEIYSTAPEGWKESKEKQTLWRAENLKQRDRILILLEEFYKNRKSNTDAHLHLKNIGLLGGFRIQSEGVHMKAEELGIKTQDDIFNKIRLYRKELNEFTNFIKEKFLSNK